jgi:hypothetical protein
MRLKNLLTAVAVSSLVATPALANEASSLSVAKAVNAKAATSAKKSNKLSGTTIAVGLLATAAVVGGIIAITDDNDDSDSN